MPASRVLTAGGALFALLLLILPARLFAAPPASPPQKFRDGLPGFFLKSETAESPIEILYLGDSEALAEELRTWLDENTPGSRVTISRFGDPLPRADLLLAECRFPSDAADTAVPEQIESLARTFWRSDPETDILLLDIPEPGTAAGSFPVRSPAASRLDFFADRAGIPALTLPSGGGSLPSLLSEIGRRHQKGLFPNAGETFARRRTLAHETAPKP